MRRQTYLWIASIIALLLLAACATTDAKVAEEGPAVEASPPVEPATGGEESEAMAAPTEVAVEPTEPVDEQPTVRTELAASNPSDFEIASGNLQLVEFFAFW